jgi:hypothetical protein
VLHISKELGASGEVSIYDGGLVPGAYIAGYFSALDECSCFGSLQRCSQPNIHRPLSPGFYGYIQS